jgi:hypothetical protein
LKLSEWNSPVSKLPACLRSALLLPTLLLSPPMLLAQLACPAGQYTVCLNGDCLCIPTLSGDLEAMAARAIETFEQIRAPVLETWLLGSRNDIYLDTAAVPEQIRSALAGRVPATVLERARYKVGFTDTLNLGNVAMNYGDLLDGRTVEAITLVDVIVFRNEADAAGNIALWAHELTHIQQFMEWGTREFARRYVEDPEAVEAPAYAAGARYRHPGTSEEAR